MKKILMCAAALTASLAICDDVSDFAKALNVGAETKMPLRIVDADGAPVPDAEVEFGFWNSHSQGGFQNTFVRSDTNGECIVIQAWCDVIRNAPCRPFLKGQDVVPRHTISGPNALALGQGR